MRLLFETRCEEQGKDPEQELTDHLQIEITYEDYWGKVTTNLQTGNIRMLFIADEISFELKRIVEFLNEQMNPAEVLAVEIKQYVGKEQKTLIPRVFGQSSKIQQKKSKQKKRKWDEPSFINELREREGEEAVETTQAILNWAKEKLLTIFWGKGIRSGSCLIFLTHEKNWYSFFSLWTYGRIEIQFQVLKNRPVYQDIKMRMKVLNQLNSIPGIYIPEDGIERRPAMSFSALASRTSLIKFFEIWEEVMHSIKTRKE